MNMFDQFIRERMFDLLRFQTVSILLIAINILEQFNMIFKFL